jgi:hypothetical protein
MPPAHLKGALVDKYAEIALYDAHENQRVILEAQAKEHKKKAAMKAALDAQVRMQQEVIMRERDEDREWVQREQERIKIWNEEERTKINQQRVKQERITKQREQQLRELDALRRREKAEQQDYDMSILRSIHKEIKMERAKEAIKRQSDADNLRQVAEQNVKHLEHLKVQKEMEAKAARALEAEWTGLLDKQERARGRLLKQTYARQALQYGAAASMQEMMNKQAEEDEARANYHAAELERIAAQREADQKSERARLQQETLDVLAIQVREKASRAHTDRERETMVLAREQQDIARAEKADAKRRSAMREANTTYARELSEQMRVQEERKVLEPFLMSKAERQMNAALLRRLPTE